MKYIFDKADSRGSFDYGWLKTNLTFSFSNYFNPDRKSFGAMRVLNDDYIAAGKGFDTHPHKNMEIISIPIFGEMEHKDNLGNHKVLGGDEIQIMSAGSGVLHSEYNRSDKEINFLQIWIFPNKDNIAPRYEFMKIGTNGHNPFELIISDNESTKLKINQESRIFLGDTQKSDVITLSPRTENHGMYLFVISGKYEINGISLTDRDGIGIYDTNAIEINSQIDGRLLAIEVPMKF